MIPQQFIEKFREAFGEAAYHLFENKLDGVIKVAVEP